MGGEEMIKIGKEEGGIICRFPYNPAYITKIKTIEGYRWHPEEKYWTVPHSEFKKLLSIFGGESIIIDPTIYLDELKKELMLRNCRLY